MSPESPSADEVDDHVAAALDGGMPEDGLAGLAEVDRFELGMHVVVRVRAVGIDAQLASAARAVVDLELGDVGQHLAALERDGGGAVADGQAGNDDAVGGDAQIGIDALDERELKAARAADEGEEAWLARPDPKRRRARDTSMRSSVFRPSVPSTAGRAPR